MNRRRSAKEVWLDFLAGVAGLPATGRLAVRSVKKRPVRAALVALSLAGSICTYMLFSAFLTGKVGSVTSRVEPLDLPSDVVAYADRSFAAEGLRALNRNAGVAALEPAVRSERLTPVGRRQVLLVAAGSRLLAGLQVVTGRMPAATGEVLLPERLAAAVGIEAGAAFPMLQVIPGANDLMRSEGVVVGVYRDADDVLTEPLMVDAIGPDSANAAFVWLRSDRDAAAMASSVRNTLGAAEVIHRGTPATIARSLVASVYRNMFLMVVLVFVFAGLGLLTVLLLSFIQRKRQFGILKASGFTNPELQYMLLAEGLLMATAGIVIGAAAGLLLVNRLNRVVETTLILRPGAVVWGVIGSLLVFYLGSAIPATICRQAPVNALLFNRRVYLNANPSCAQCGRCGGF